MRFYTLRPPLIWSLLVVFVTMCSGLAPRYRLPDCLHVQAARMALEEEEWDKIKAEVRASHLLPATQPHLHVYKDWKQRQLNKRAPQKP